MSGSWSSTARADRLEFSAEDWGAPHLIESVKHQSDMTKNPVGRAIEAFFAGMIFIPIGAILYSVTQSLASGIFLALMPAFFALVELREADDLAEEGTLIVTGWISGLAEAIYFFPLYWAFGLLSVLLALVVLLAKIGNLV
jgi:hypothetical protein